MLSYLDTGAFLNAFRGFIACRGSPVKIFTDNWTNFIQGEVELRYTFEHHTKDTLRQFSAPQGIEWVFIPPKSLHFGGVWERLVGVIKCVFKAVMPDMVNLTDEMLATLFCEIVVIINSRSFIKMRTDYW